MAPSPKAWSLEISPRYTDSGNDGDWITVYEYSRDECKHVGKRREIDTATAAAATAATTTAAAATTTTRVYVCTYVYVDCVIKQIGSEPYSPDYAQPVLSTFTLNPLL